MADGSPLTFESEVAGRTLTKADLVETIYTRIGGVSRRDASDVVEMVFECIKETLSNEGDEPVKVSGFGNFVVKKKNARILKNPHTKEDIHIAARRVLSFKASQVLKNALNS